MNLIRALSTVSGMTLLSRITGLARESIKAVAFGAGAQMDTFEAAFRLPNILRRLFAEGAFAQAFVPIFAEYKRRCGDEETQALVGRVGTLLALALLVVTVVGVLAAPWLVYVLASDFVQTPGKVALTADMIRIVFPYIFFVSLVSLSGGILNVYRRFAIPAVTPVLLNVSIIGAAWFLSPWLRGRGIEPIYALTAGVMLGGALQLAVQFPALARIGAFPRLGMTPRAVVAAWRHPGVHRILSQMGPALIGVSVAQFSMLINTQIASHQGVGAVSWLFYADRLMEFPTALLGVALGLVLTPQLSAAEGRNDAAGYSALLDWGLRLVLLLALPCAIALLVFSNALVAVLFHRGAFDANDVHKTVTALMGYGVGLIGLVAVKILAPGFYARQDTRTPVKIAIGVLVLTQFLNLLFVPFLGHAGLALSIGCGALVNAGFLFFGLRRRGAYLPSPGWGPFTLRVLFANLLLGGLLAWGSGAVDWIGLRSQPWLRAGWLSVFLTGATLGYFAVLAVIGTGLKQFARRG
jgi:putative peptidoglycan lipid II flippase